MGQSRQSVWDYPRPPRVERSYRQIRVVFNDTVIAETNRSVRVLETSHPPVYYIPPGEVQTQFLSQSGRTIYCEFKGRAVYYKLRLGDRTAVDAAWSYHNPASGYESIKDHIAFYPGRVDACYVDGQFVQTQEGDFYGGWITSDIEGPLKGGRATRGW